ncbi:MAG: type IV secretion system DNA-binding domain-containing protein [Candidatus Pacebacteria bacterium]|nr:type IV secretion system DNA-binding domain-containing protein [Candidatus Paceibacterota bacterium]
MELPEIPINKDVTYLGLTTFRDKNQLFGIKRKDRRQHVYILGKSGTGKSVLMFNMIIQNIQNGEGVCVVDPHGELVEGVLSAIPPDRIKDVVYFNPADADHHIGFNVLELIDPQYKHLVASGLMGIFTKIWANAWSARMEYILNNCILALLDTPGTTLLGIPRMLVDKDYRQKIIGNLKDPVIKAFWVHEYEAWQDKFRNEAIAPIQNKVGQFLSTSIIRNVVGQSTSTINIFDIMNDGKIFLVNVSKGRIGEDNSGLLGGMIITKIQLAAMERVRIPEEHRKDFYLYVDEFQNFVTDAFAGILSEARKYRLNLTVAHQYTAQLVVDKSSAVRDAVFGNVGTMIVFRVGSDDADFLEKEFDPEFTPGDIVNLPNYKIYIKLMIDGVTSRPFSAKTLPPMVKSGNKEIEDEVIESSRKLYCRPRTVVEREINDWSGMSLGDEAGSGTGILEKFPAICSLCGKNTTVPFKPEPGRPVYCKDCVAKIKSGEVKVEKKGQDQIRFDETTFYKPLADLGIEFKQKNNKDGVDENYVESTERSVLAAKKPGIISSFKKVFTKPKPVNNYQSKPPVVKNAGLKEVLSKALSEPITPKPTTPPVVTPAPIPEPVSLNTLKDKIKTVTQTPITSKDRAASAEDMNKLKDLIAAKSTGQATSELTSTSPKEEVPKSKTKEVPEDVLKKILE